MSSYVNNPARFFRFSFATVLACGFFLAAMTPQESRGAIVASFDFNTHPADNNSGTGTVTPQTGTGLASLVNVSANGTGFFIGSPNDPYPTVDNSSFASTSYPAQGTGNKTGGYQFAVDTTGFENFVVSYDQRGRGSTFSQYWTFQYSSDGTNFTDFQTYFQAGGYLTYSFNLSAIDALEDNPLAKFRIVATFNPSTGTYTNTAAAYSPTGAVDIDLFTVSGTAVPEPGAAANLLCLAAGLLIRLKRRR